MVIAQPSKDEFLPIGYVPAKINKTFKAKLNWIVEADYVLIDQKGILMPYISAKYNPVEKIKSRFSNLEIE